MVPSSLVDAGSFFERDTSFLVNQPAGAAAPCHRHVLFVGLEADRNSLGYYAVTAALLAFIAGVITAVCKHDVGTGAEVGAGVGGTMGLILVYVFWRLS